MLMPAVVLRRAARTLAAPLAAATFSSRSGDGHNAPWRARGVKSFVQAPPSGTGTVGVSIAAPKASCCPGHAASGTHSNFCSVAAGGGGNSKEEEVEEILEGKEMLVGDESFDFSRHPVWNPPPIDDITANNRKWVAKMTREDPDFFKRQVGAHKPDYLYIGCSDARLSVQGLLGLEQGQLFVHRNIANMVVNTDINFLSVLTYAVEYLKVKNIFICGHYDCGGVRAAMRNQDHGLIEHWIMGIRDVARLHRKELLTMTDDESMHRRLVELNVQEQALKLYANPVVQRNQALHGWPHIHAFVYDVGDGLVRELDVDFKSLLSKYRHVYSMYKFDGTHAVGDFASTATAAADTAAGEADAAAPGGVAAAEAVAATMPSGLPRSMVEPPQPPQQQESQQVAASATSR